MTQSRTRHSAPDELRDRNTFALVTGAIQLCITMVFFLQAEVGIRDLTVTGVQTCALPIWESSVWTSWSHVHPGTSPTPRTLRWLAIGSVRRTVAESRSPRIRAKQPVVPTWSRRM